MIVRIHNRCIGCGACSAINSKIFEIKNSKAAVNEINIYGCEDDCIDAALTCPVDAIRIDDF